MQKYNVCLRLTEVSFLLNKWIKHCFLVKSLFSMLMNGFSSPIGTLKMVAWISLRFLFPLEWVNQARFGLRYSNVHCSAANFSILVWVLIFRLRLSSWMLTVCGEFTLSTIPYLAPEFTSTNTKSPSWNWFSFLVTRLPKRWKDESLTDWVNSLTNSRWVLSESEIRLRIPSSLGLAWQWNN